MTERYKLDGHKLLWHLDRVLEWQQGKRITPIYVEISPTSACNHNCIFCGLDFAHTKEYLPTDLTVARIREMGELGVRSIMFAGEGEPLLHKGLEQMVQACHDSGIDASMTTNGSINKRERWEAIVPNMTWIRFSIDAGSSDVYGRIHGTRSNAFDKTCSSVANAIAIRNERGCDTTIGIQYLLINQGVDDLERSLEQFMDMGVDYFSIKPFSKHPQMTSEFDHIYTEDTIAAVDEVVARHNDDSRTHVIFRKGATNCYMNGNKHYQHCHALPFWGYVSSAGEFFTCSVFLGCDEFNTGSIVDQSMAEIFQGDRRAESVRHACEDFEVTDKCRLNCRMARVNEFLEELAEVPNHVNFI